eukprot:1130527-Rhodomonas_salina.3
MEAGTKAELWCATRMWKIENIETVYAAGQVQSRATAYGMLGTDIVYGAVLTPCMALRRCASTDAGFCGTRCSAATRNSTA